MIPLLDPLEINPPAESFPHSPPPLSEFPSWGTFGNLVRRTSPEAAVSC